MFVDSFIKVLVCNDDSYNIMLFLGSILNLFDEYISQGDEGRRRGILRAL